MHISVSEARTYLEPDEPVILVTSGDAAVIYPIRVLTWHEIVNDVVGTTPLSITFCPLCNTGIVFRREFKDTVLDFGTTGRLSGSNLIMYDRQTETWWQQATGEGIIGTHAGEHLALHPARTLSFGQAVIAEPSAVVLSDETGHSRPYGTNPYPNYDAPGSRPFLFRGPIDGDRDAMERALVVRAGDAEAVVPYGDVAESGTKRMVLDGHPVILFFAEGTRSALDTPDIARGRDVGSINAYRAEVDGRPAEFTPIGENTFRDSVTGSDWNAGGVAVSGPLRGETLAPVVAIQHFWFSARYFTE